ncbi:Protein O-glucosyltransferase 1, partial [Cucurbita argyrosperma subsp. sororia]
MKRCVDRFVHQILCCDSYSSDAQPPRWRCCSLAHKPTFKTLAFVFCVFLVGFYLRLQWIKAPTYWWEKGIGNEDYKSNLSGVNLYRPSDATCPPYFRWIHEDLRHWRETGIRREMLERARKTAHFRVVILDGRVYVEKYMNAFQTRDVFTLWGILQLVRWHPGKLPDLELMFNCDDLPVVRSNDFWGQWSVLPPLFGYCSDESSLDIAFPDWSFWGWVELNIKPWRKILEDIREGNKRTKWEDRVPFAYWKGNPEVHRSRKDLLKCNLTQHHNWGTLVYAQDWSKESRQGFKQSKLEDQCTHRYKIYIEGRAWSVSEKYIISCDSMTLYVKPKYFDFFIRGMVPLEHFWPINDQSKCHSLKFAVEWGNNHTNQAQAIGEEGSKYFQENLKMEFVYDYMFHLLNEYSKLLTFRPTVPAGAVELKLETMIGSAVGLTKKFMEDSMEKSPSKSGPCDLPPHDPTVQREFQNKTLNALKQVDIWEKEYWKAQRKGKWIWD